MAPGNTPVISYESISFASEKRTVSAKPPPLYYLEVECAASEPVSLYTLPNSLGAPLTSACCQSPARAGQLLRVDATITVTVRAESLTPLVDVPAADHEHTGGTRDLALLFQQGGKRDRTRAFGHDALALYQGQDSRRDLIV